MDRRLQVPPNFAPIRIAHILVRRRVLEQQSAELLTRRRRVQIENAEVEGLVTNFERRVPGLLVPDDAGERLVPSGTAGLVWGAGLQLEESVGEGGGVWF